MYLVPADKVHDLLDYPTLIAALHEAHRCTPPEGQHMIGHEPGGGENQFVTLLGWKPNGPASDADNGAIVVKMVGVFPGNLKLDPPQASVQGLVAVFDAGTGAPRLVADGEAMTFRKTAADSGLGSSLLSRPDAETLLVVGAGGLGPHVLASHLAARPSIKRVMIWNRTAARAEALAAKTEAPGIDVSSVTDLDDAVAQADIVSCVTMSREPLIKGALLNPGAHVDLVGAYLPDMREADDEVMRRGTLFVDTRVGMEGSGEISAPVAAGVIGWDAVRADYFDLVQGRHAGRTSQDEITVCKNVGAGHLDLFAAQALMQALAGQAA